MKAFSRTDKSVLGRWWWTVDHGMLAALAVLIVCGVALVTAASPPVAERIGFSSYHFVIRHIIFLVPSIFVLISVSMLEPKWIWRLSTVVLAVGIVSLVIVLFAGAEIKGAHRWIRLFGFSIQPSEFVRPSFAIISAWLISLHKEKPEFPSYIICALLYFIVVGLLLAEPDLGMTIILTASMATQIFLSGLPVRYLVVLALCFVALLFAAYHAFSHVEHRIDTFMNSSGTDSYQTDQALSAIKNGGLLGLGPGQGEVKLNIPDSHADYIFSVACEEMGMLFIIILLSIYAFIILRGVSRLIESEKLFSVLAVGGLLAMFSLQSLIHMGTNVNIIPAKGMTLPFISYGGSSLLASAFAMGMVLALTRKQPRSGIARGGLVTRTRTAYAARTKEGKR